MVGAIVISCKMRIFASCIHEILARVVIVKIVAGLARKTEDHSHGVIAFAAWTIVILRIKKLWS